MKLVKSENEKSLDKKITDEEAEQAFVKIIKYIGEDQQERAYYQPLKD